MKQPAGGVWSTCPDPTESTCPISCATVPVTVSVSTPYGARVSRQCAASTTRCWDAVCGHSSSGVTSPRTAPSACDVSVVSVSAASASWTRSSWSTCEASVAPPTVSATRHSCSSQGRTPVSPSSG
ncbi:hypothetical protein [Lapillicoccus jejuensis]|uniref:hypothetical protein n=1 Tax=Lapillicoccus jejuensis TaxID=402171 RepID=UPI001152EAB0|nr:hypothetical protein [Lapillicoccus jejuensis]